MERLPAREDRDPTSALFRDVTADRLRMATGRACRDAGVPHFGPHALGTAGSRCCTLPASRGPTSAIASARSRRVVTADRYSHALVDREIDRVKALERVRAMRAPVRAHDVENRLFAGVF